MPTDRTASGLQAVDLGSVHPKPPRDTDTDAAPASSWAFRSINWRSVFAAPAWPLFVVFVVCCAPPLIALKVANIKPNNRAVAPGDNSFSYPFKPNTVSSIAAVVGPFCAWLASTLVVECGLRRARGATSALAGMLYHSIDIVGAYLVARLVNYATKPIVGYKRPYFSTACAPPPAGSPPGTPCIPTGITKKLDAASVSFPSGHSMSSAFFATFAAIYVLHAFLTHPAVGRGRRLSASLRNDLLRSAGLVFAFGLMLIPWCIGVSRVMDHRHHPADVLTGWLLGGVVGTLAVIRSLVGRSAVVAAPAPARKEAAAGEV